METASNKKYKLIKRIGEGASGKAYLVENIMEKVNINNVIYSFIVLLRLYILIQ